jgi:hypothetical protein
MKNLFNWLFGSSKKTKVVKIKITYPNYFDDSEEVDVVVPVGLSEEDENIFINEIVENDYRTWK